MTERFQAGDKVEAPDGYNRGIVDALLDGRATVAEGEIGVVVAEQDPVFSDPTVDVEFRTGLVRKVPHGELRRATWGGSAGLASSGSGYEGAGTILIAVAFIFIGVIGATGYTFKWIGMRVWHGTDYGYSVLRDDAALGLAGGAFAFMFLAAALAHHGFVFPRRWKIFLVAVTGTAAWCAWFVWAPQKALPLYLGDEWRSPPAVSFAVGLVSTLLLLHWRRGRGDLNRLIWSIPFSAALAFAAWFAWTEPVAQNAADLVWWHTLSVGAGAWSSLSLLWGLEKALDESRSLRERLIVGGLAALVGLAAIAASQWRIMTLGPYSNMNFAMIFLVVAAAMAIPVAIGGHFIISGLSATGITWRRPGWTVFLTWSIVSYFALSDYVGHDPFSSPLRMWPFPQG